MLDHIVGDEFDVVNNAGLLTRPVAAISHNAIQIDVPCKKVNPCLALRLKVDRRNFCKNTSCECIERYTCH